MATPSPVIQRLQSGAAYFTVQRYEKILKPLPLVPRECKNYWFIDLFCSKIGITSLPLRLIQGRQDVLGHVSTHLDTLSRIL